MEYEWLHRLEKLPGLLRNRPQIRSDQTDNIPNSKRSYLEQNITVYMYEVSKLSEMHETHAKKLLTHIKNCKKTSHFSSSSLKSKYLFSPSSSVTCLFYGIINKINITINNINPHICAC